MNNRFWFPQNDHMFRMRCKWSKINVRNEQIRGKSHGQTNYECYKYLRLLLMLLRNFNCPPLQNRCVTIDILHFGAYRHGHVHIYHFSWNFNVAGSTSLCCSKRSCLPSNSCQSAYLQLDIWLIAIWAHTRANMYVCLSVRMNVEQKRKNCQAKNNATNAILLYSLLCREKSHHSTENYSLNWLQI